MAVYLRAGGGRLEDIARGLLLHVRLRERLAAAGLPERPEGGEKWP